jgi:gliding motility-associated lipoprotein GldD
LKRGLFLFIIIWCFCACKTDNFVPKPRGYYAITFPEKKYISFEDNACPYFFKYPSYGFINKDTTFFKDKPDHPCWLNISFPAFNATLHLSYKEISGRNNLEKLVGDSYKLTFKHSIKADFIDETYFEKKNDNVYGFIYDVGGDAASAVQFFATDSISNFVRGSLYFNCEPNSDSLQPSVDFFRKDIVELVNSIHWK